jgi:hypothetical protein
MVRKRVIPRLFSRKQESIVNASQQQPHGTTDLFARVMSVLSLLVAVAVGLVPLYQQRLAQQESFAAEVRPDIKSIVTFLDPIDKANSSEGIKRSYRVGTPHYLIVSNTGSQTLTITKCLNIDSSEDAELTSEKISMMSEGVWSDIFDARCDIQTEGGDKVSLPIVLQAGESKSFKFLNTKTIQGRTMGLVKAKVDAGYKMNSIELLENIVIAGTDSDRKQLDSKRSYIILITGRRNWIKTSTFL